MSSQPEDDVTQTAPAGPPKQPKVASDDPATTPAVPLPTPESLLHVCVIVMSGWDDLGRSYQVGTEPLLVGRSDAAQVIVEDEGVSRRHLQLQLLPDGAIELKDLKSRNGTFVNGAPAQHQLLKHGDVIQIGHYTNLKIALRDSTEADLHQRLYESATLDPLTGLLNKRALMECLERELKFGTRHGEPVSALIIDVDHFKRVNDQFGHLAGDDFLRKLTRILQSCIRVEDVLGRYGGEEFVVLLRCTDGSGAHVLAERMRRMVRAQPMVLPDGRIDATVSIGLSCMKAGEALSPAELLKRADQNLYLAKQRGRDRVEGDQPR